MKKIISKIMLTLVFASMLFTAFESGFSNGALVLEGVETWYWLTDTYIRSVASADVDGDGAVEIVTGGLYWENLWFRYAQLAVWDGATLSLEGVRTWCWGYETAITSIAVGDVDGDGDMEIVTGGSYIDGEYRGYAQLAVWDGATLSLEDVTTWYWGELFTGISSVAVRDIDWDGSVEIVTGGAYYDGTRYVAQLAVWDGATLALERVKTWCWVDDTTIFSVACGDVDGDDQTEIVTGGYYNDGTRLRAQLVVWDGATLSLEGVRTWCWVDDTWILSVALADVDGDGSTEIVTGGWYEDGTRDVAQLCVWTGSTLALEAVRTWYWMGGTIIYSVACADVDGDEAMEIVTGGYHHDGTRDVAQLAVWDGTLSLEDVTTWYWTDSTEVSSVAVGDVDDDGSVEIVTGGYYNDGTRYNAQLCVWGFT